MVAAAWQRTVKGDEPRGVEVSQHVAVENEKRVVDARLVCREGDRARRVERLGLDDVLEGDPGDLVGGEGLDEGVRPVAEREHSTVDPVTSQPLDDVHDHRALDHRQHLLGDLVGERPQPGPLAADENDGVHQPVVVVVVAGLVVVVVVAGLVVVVEVVVVVVWDLRNAATRWAPGGVDTEAPFATKASMYISPLP